MIHKALPILRLRSAGAVVDAHALTHAHVHICTHGHTHTHTHAHTRTHTHTHAHTISSGELWRYSRRELANVLTHEFCKVLLW